ncbi:translation initiation inhibitor [Echinococcus multilocularis]|uniref:Translation initiation inhibitor n=1 Tax=Echinococcus multilocularis TaxID=6211 RepID=A0A068YF15_ECHMU|nr:translation initiation inhibitor [Echinococcus multilocularis]
MEIAGPSVEQQTEQTLKNLSSIVKAGGGQMKDIVKTTILLANMEDFATVNEIYAKCVASTSIIVCRFYRPISC